MEALSLLKFYAFGNRFQHLLQTKNLRGIPAYEIEAFLEDLDFFNLQVTKKACRDLEGLPRILKKDKSKRGGIGDEEWAIHIRKIMEKIRLTLESEMSLINVYIPTQKRYDVNRLLEDVASLFAPKVFEKLPELAQYDLDEAGKCFAFERPTAAAFHVLRATEGVLRHFYTSLTKRKKLPQEKQNWGAVITALQSRKKTEKYSTLYNNLDNIKNSYRNPTQHPDAKYDIHKAQDLFGLCIEAINRMVQILDEVTNKSKP